MRGINIQIDNTSDIRLVPDLFTWRGIRPVDSVGYAVRPTALYRKTNDYYYGFMLDILLNVKLNTSKRDCWDQHLTVRTWLPSSAPTCTTVAGQAG